MKASKRKPHIVEQQKATVKYVELRIKEIVETNNDEKVTFKLKLSNGIRWETEACDPNGILSEYHYWKEAKEGDMVTAIVRGIRIENIHRT